ncbi:MAG: fumarylacetoacetate hydrolase family protein [Hyphomicrobiales bacterium]
MKLLRYGPKGREKPGLLDNDGKVRDLSGIVDDITPEVIAKKLGTIKRTAVSKLPVVKGRPRMGVPVSGFQKFLCIGLNYTDHAEETNNPIPDEPVLFTKTMNALNGPNDNVVLVKGSKKTDWEVELGIVIGTRAKHVTKKDALKYVAGYTVINDVSEREWQNERGGQWVKGKACDTYGPVGPWLVTADEVGNVQKLDLWLDLNDERQQTGTTSKMIFSVAHIVSYLSKIMTLEPGDIIATGTPPGVGAGQKPQKFVKPGDVMSLGISKLGEQRQKVVKG